MSTRPWYTVESQLDESHFAIRGPVKYFVPVFPAVVVEEVESGGGTGELHIVQDVRLAKNLDNKR